MFVDRYMKAKQNRMNLKPHLLLLHGALGSSQQLTANGSTEGKPLVALLEKQYTIHLLDFEGHGGTSSDRPFAMEYFAENVLTYLDAKDIQLCEVFGYSMGGYVALKVAAISPGRISRITTLGTKFGWTPDVAAKETAFLVPELMQTKVAVFAKGLEETHAPADWKVVVTKTADMMRALGDRPELSETDLKRIQIPVRLLLGSEDHMVTKEETEHVKTLLPNATFQIVEGWKHPIERVGVEQLAELIRQ